MRAAQTWDLCYGRRNAITWLKSGRPRDNNNSESFSDRLKNVLPKVNMIGIRIFKANNHFVSLANMMKPRILATERLKKRLEEKARDKKYIRNSADLLFIGGDCQGFSPSLVVSSEGNSYLFNCGEGTQRFCFTNKIRLVNLEHVFVTSHDWNRIAGIYGLALTVQDIGAPKICIHTAEGTDNLFESTRTFMNFNTGIQCLVDTSLNEYQDSNIQIQPISLISNPKTSSSNDELQHMDKKTKQTGQNLSKLIAYSCHLPDIQGPLDPVKCKELNVPIGRQLAVLKSGQDLELPDGRIIKSSDVCGPKSAGLSFIIIECPSKDHVESVIANSTLSQLRKNRASKGEKQIGIVVHYTPQNVVKDSRYREWIDGFSTECKHLFVIHDDQSRLNFVDCYRFQFLLRKLDENIFPQLNLPEHLAQQIEKQLEESSKNPATEKCISTEEDNKILRLVATDELDKSDRFINVNSMDRFVFRPKKCSESIENHVAIDILYREAVEGDPHFEELLSDLKRLQSNIPKPKDYEPEVVFLGTGSALPSKLRNTSCILINFHHSNESVIFDCGEDSYGQMFRLYGPDKVGEILRQLKMIYISHHHTDHHIGLIELLRNRKRFTKPTDRPVQLLLPPGVDKLLNFYNKNFDDLQGSYELYSTKKMLPRHGYGPTTDTTDSNKVTLIDRLDGLLKSIDLVPVEHCQNSCAVVMSFNIGKPDMSKFSIAYSGDAKPSTEFATKGKDCDLLIHEATFEHRLEADALVKKHSTSTQAIGVAKAMNAKFTILTHFSARLPKVPYFTKEFDDTVGFAFDNMSIRCPTDFARLPILKSICSSVFKKSLEDCDMKHFKQELKQKTIEDILRLAKKADSVE